MENKKSKLVQYCKVIGLIKNNEKKKIQKIKEENPHSWSYWQTFSSELSPLIEKKLNYQDKDFLSGFTLSNAINHNNLEVTKDQVFNKKKKNEKIIKTIISKIAQNYIT